MIKYFFTILISLLIFNQTLAKDISINENINLEFVCELEKNNTKHTINERNMKKVFLL